MSRFLGIITGLFFAALLFFSGGVLVQAQNIISDDVCAEAPTSEVCIAGRNPSTVDPVSGPGGIINTAANLIAIIGGVAAVIVIIISGIMYVTAGGAAAGQRAGDNPNKAKNALMALQGAVVGLLVIVLAWAITRFITERVIQ